MTDIIIHFLKRNSRQFFGYLCLAVFLPIISNAGQCAFEWLPFYGFTLQYITSRNDNYKQLIFQHIFLIVIEKHQLYNIYIWEAFPIGLFTVQIGPFPLTISLSILTPYINIITKYSERSAEYVICFGQFLSMRVIKVLRGFNYPKVLVLKSNSSFHLGFDIIIFYQ